MVFVDRESDIPLYEQIYSCIKEAILSGKMKAGDLLPPTRKLAGDLVVGRNTVENAYQQLLLEGYINSRIGSGYRVNELDLSRMREVSENVKPLKKKDYQIACRYDFKFTKLEKSSFPGAELRKHVNDAMREVSASNFEYPSRQGGTVIRDDIAAYLYETRGIETNPDNIIITCGHQYSLSIISNLLRLQGPIHIAMEDPGYPGAREVLKLAGADIIPIPVESDGIDALMVKSSGANAVYLTPSRQYPTGVVLSIRKQLELIGWASETGSWIIENDDENAMRYHMRPSPSLFATDTAKRVIYIGTLSKPVSLVLGFGYIVLPDSLSELYHKKYALHYNSVPPVIQRAISTYLKSGEYARHRERFRASCHRKHDLLLQEAERIFGDRVSISGTGSGIHLLFTVNNGHSSEWLIREAMRYGVRVYGLSETYAVKSREIRGQVMLGYCGIALEDIRPALEALNSAWFPGNEENV